MNENNIPKNLDYYRVEKALKYIYENMKAQPSLEEVAKHIGINEFDLQKTFKRWAGVSPKKFLDFLTIEHAKRLIKNSKVEETANDLGLSGTSRLHDLFIKIEAVTPAQYKKLGEDILIQYGFHQTQFGEALIAITTKGLSYLNFVLTDHSSALKNLESTWPKAKLISNPKATLEYKKRIFDRNIQQDINLFLKGTPFQLKVWKALLEIPEGNLSTYKNIAIEIKNPKALRAVGSAIGSNLIAYLIPCHRVINSIGKIGNYSAGKYRKPSIIGWEIAKRTLD